MTKMSRDEITKYVDAAAKRLEATLADMPYLKGPLDRYSERCDAHGTKGHRGDDYLTCKCGRTFKTANGRGLHVSAEERKASKLYDVEAEAAREEWKAQRDAAPVAPVLVAAAEAVTAEAMTARRN